MRDQSTYVNVGEVLPDLSLLQVKIFEFDWQKRDRLRSLVYAASGRYADARWHLHRVRRTDIDEKGFVTASHSDDQRWETSVTPEMMSVFLVQPGQLPVWKLKKYIEHLLQNSQDTRAYELAYWGKLFLPLSTAVMVILAIPFVFGSLRSGSLGRQLFFGIMIGLGFYVLNKALGYIVLVYGVPPLIGVISAPLVVLCAAVVLYRRVA
jgi:lipopolysaccharide export system permease protein